MSTYAVVEGNFIANLIEWDGVSGDFPTAIPNDDLDARIGDAYIDGVLYPKPRDKWDAKYKFDLETRTWSEIV